ncbi:MAG TPA: hypothetical protein DCP26_01410, partial [Brevundimonas sp.]|nr:hypothetical protein [Brevundimonas sp.]
MTPPCRWPSRSPGCSRCPSSPSSSTKRADGPSAFSATPWEPDHDPPPLEPRLRFRRRLDRRSGRRPA